MLPSSMPFKVWLTSRNLIFAFATIVHLTWGFSLLLSPELLETTGVSLMIKLCGGQHLAGLVFILGGLLATVSVADYTGNPLSNMLMMIPQQMFLFVAAISATFCIIDGQFADGVARSSVFLLIDQMWLIVICLVHSIALAFRFIPHRNIFVLESPERIKFC